MSKPSWDEAPEWANWLAMDDGGSWYWHAGKPFFDFADGAWYDPDIENEICGLALASFDLDRSASETLESRP